MGFGYSYHNQIIVGYAPALTYPGTRTHRLDSAEEWSAFSFIAPPGGATLNKVLVYVSGVAGAPLTDAKLQCEVYTDTAGVPDTSLATTTTVTAKPAAAAWVEFTGFTLALTGGALYWVVLKNIEADPTTKYPIYRYITNGTPRLTSNQRGVFSAKMTGDSGTTWNTDVSNMIAGWRLEFSDGFSGYPLSDASSGTASYAVYENREQGAYFTTSEGAVGRCWRYSECQNSGFARQWHQIQALQRHDTCGHVEGNTGSQYVFDSTDDGNVYSAKGAGCEYCLPPDNNAQRSGWKLVKLLYVMLWRTPRFRR